MSLPTLNQIHNKRKYKIEGKKSHTIYSRAYFINMYKNFLKRIKLMEMICQFFFAYFCLFFIRTQNSKRIPIPTINEGEKIDTHMRTTKWFLHKLPIRQFFSFLFLFLFNESCYTANHQKKMSALNSFFIINVEKTSK